MNDTRLGVSLGEYIDSFLSTRARTAMKIRNLLRATWCSIVSIVRNGKRNQSTSTQILFNVFDYQTNMIKITKQYLHRSSFYKDS